MADLDIDNICRLCCEKKGRLRSLFEQKSASGSLSLQQIILDVTRLEVAPGDGMPQKICRPCSSALQKMHETIEGYRTNDLKLRQQLLMGGTLFPDVEIKEEEVDIELLEKGCKQDMMVEDICIKQEVQEEHLDCENLDESKESEPAEEDDSETDADDDTVQHDDEWLPIEENKEEEEPKPEEPKPEKPKAKKRVLKPKVAKRKYTRKNPNDPPPPKPGRTWFQDFKCYICKDDPHETAEALLAHLHGKHLDMLPYTCPDCVQETVVIKTIAAVHNHIRQHLNPEKCPFCDRRYTNKRGVDLHITLHHKGDNKPNPVPCEQCGKVCPSKLALRYHMRLHTSGATCEICGKAFLERSKLQQHIETRHEKLKKYECHICKKKLTSMGSVQNHIDTYHTTQVFTCSYCPKTFSSKLTHRYHEKKHVENENYVATKDWREYYTVLEGDEVKGNKLKKCNLCGFESRNMPHHLHAAHFPTEYRCEICGATFRYKPTYVAHVETHEHGKAHRCPICGREFSERRNLISHLRTKQHREHPLAVAMLGTLRSANTSKSDEAGSDANYDETQDDSHIESEAATSSIMLA